MARLRTAHPTPRSISASFSALSSPATGVSSPSRWPQGAPPPEGCVSDCVKHWAKFSSQRLTFAQTFSDNTHCVVRKLTTEEIIAVRDGRESCPVCLHPMRYRTVPLRMAKWCPSEYSWVCDRHGHPVYLIDGSILDGDESWATRHKKEKIRRMNKHLSSIILPKPSEDDSQGDGEI